MDGRGAILDVAREISEALRDSGLPGVVIGGVAVVLHGHVRTTVDVNVHVGETCEAVAALLTSRGFSFDPARREFSRHGVPVHLVLLDQLGEEPRRTEEIDGVVIPSLADLVTMKLGRGTRNYLRAQDLADVIGLVRARGLGSGFARFVGKDVRPEFRRIVREIRKQSGP